MEKYIVGSMPPVNKNGEYLKITIYAMAAFYVLAMIGAFIVFPLIYAKNVIQYSTIADPLNINHPAFKFTTMVDIGSRWTPKNVFTTYRIFLLVPMVMMLFSFAFTKMYWNTQTSKHTRVKTLVGVWIIPVFMFAATFGVLKAASLLVRGDIRAINNVNFYILSHFYNSTDFNVLSRPDVDRLHQIQTYQSLLNNILSTNGEQQEENFAKALFTINLYLTFYEIGIRHKNVDDALRLFNTSSRLFSNNFADYLSPKTVFVQNRIGEILANVRDDENTRAMRMKAKALANTWVNELNIRLGSISYASASMAFIVVTIGLLLIYGVPIKFFLQYMSK